MLEPDALAEIAAVIAAADDVDVVYSDEDKLDELGPAVPCPISSPTGTRTCCWPIPYLGHVTAHPPRAPDAGSEGSAPEFDGSQDFDVMLRATELARRVVHIPKVLYHWRVVAGSAAGDTDAKPWAYPASRRVLEDAVARRGIARHGRRRDRSTARTRYVAESSGSPTVSVIIPFRDQAALTVACLESLDTAPGYADRARWYSSTTGAPSPRPGHCGGGSSSGRTPGCSTTPGRSTGRPSTTWPRPPASPTCCCS